MNAKQHFYRATHSMQQRCMLLYSMVAFMSENLSKRPNISSNLSTTW